MIQGLRRSSALTSVKAEDCKNFRRGRRPPDLFRRVGRSALRTWRADVETTFSVRLRSGSAGETKCCERGTLTTGLQRCARRVGKQGGTSTAHGGERSALGNFGYDHTVEGFHIAAGAAPEASGLERLGLRRGRSLSPPTEERPSPTFPNAAPHAHPAGRHFSAPRLAAQNAHPRGVALRRVRGQQLAGPLTCLLSRCSNPSRHRGADAQC